MNNIKERGIWTWGHVIYDYRGFFRNMKSLRLNKITIWNDFSPVNAKAIIEEAHSNGIAVVWGFSWGWNTDCKNTVSNLTENGLNKIKESVISTFLSQYKDISADGIYFQSFTELDSKEINGNIVAEKVVSLVNSTAEELFEFNPDLNIEFGLHATSVKNDLNIIAKTDRRIKIVWEDLGAFPFTYNPADIDNFNETFSLAEKILHLRGENEKCGFIIKGMTTLDWSKFIHATGPLTIGESNADFIRQRQIEKNPIWEDRTEGWHKNIGYAEKIFDIIKASDNAVCVQALIEDGMFENEIKEPAVMFARLCTNK